MKKSTGIFISLALTVVACYFVNKLLPKSDYKSLKKLGDKYFIKKDYNNAIIYYLKCVHMLRDTQVLIRLSQCYMKLDKHKEALDYLKDLSCLEVIKWRSECYRKLNLEKDFLKELALYESFVKDEEIQKEVMETLKDICSKETEEYINKEGIKVNKEDILRGLISIEGVSEIYDTIIKEGSDTITNEESDTITNKSCDTIINEKSDTIIKEGSDTIINEGHNDISQIKGEKTKKKKKKSKRNEPTISNDKPTIGNDKPTISNDKPTISNDKPIISNDKPTISNDEPTVNNGEPTVNNDDIRNMLEAIILFYKGKKDLSYSLLDKSTYKYSILIKAYLFNENFETDDPSYLDDVTSLYFYAKVNKKDTLVHLTKALEMSQDLPLSSKDFLYADLILYYINKKDFSKVNDIIEEISPLTRYLEELVGEYYLKNKEYSKLQEISSPLLLALYNLSINKKEEAINILRGNLTSFKNYLYLGNILINDDIEESRDLFIKSIKYSSNYDEVYIAKHSLLLIEVHEYITTNKSLY